MKNWIGLLSLAVLAGCSSVGDGEVTTEKVTLDAFDTMQITTPIDTYITVSPAHTNGLDIAIDQNLQGQVSYELTEGMLTISSKDKIEPTSSSIYASSNTFDHLVLDKQTRAWLAIHQFDDFTISINGTSELNLSKVELEDFTIDVAGQADLHARGIVKNLVITISGTGDLDLSGLNSHKASVTIIGNANVILGTVNDLEVQISGSGDVKYKTGAQAMVQSYISGAGQVTAYK